MNEIKGRGVSPGFASGTAWIYLSSRIDHVPTYKVNASDVNEENQRLKAAIDKAVDELNRIQDAVHRDIGKSESMIFEAQIALLNDSKFKGNVRNRIYQDLNNAETAFINEIDSMTDMLRNLENEYFRERANDFYDIGRRVLNHLVNEQIQRHHTIPKDSVIVTEELLPSDTVSFNDGNVVAIVAERGGENSHAAILARSLGIPLVLGALEATRKITNGMPILVDGETGSITLLPTETQQFIFKDKKTRFNDETAVLESIEYEISQTLDGHEVNLFANIGRHDEAQDVIKHNLKGVGLLRTEYLFLEVDTPPGTTDQQNDYLSISRSINDLPLTIRTLDLGGDKLPRFLKDRHESNPTMGIRGLRFSLMEKILFTEQIQAILKISHHRNVRILLPMVIDVHDFVRAKAIIETIADKLSMTKLPPIGAMIETPSAVFQIEEIVQEADFVSVGTNDLVQFVLAADRQSAAMMGTSFVMHPSMLKAFRIIIEAAASHNRPVSICGEAAGDPVSASLFVGLGAKSLSMSPIRSARVRKQVRQSEYQTLKDIAYQACKIKYPDDVRKLLDEAISIDFNKNDAVNGRAEFIH